MAKKRTTTKATAEEPKLDDLTGGTDPAEAGAEEAALPAPAKEAPKPFNAVVAEIMAKMPRLSLRAARRKAVFVARESWVAAGRPRV